jgi:hypothetical protein
MIDVTPINDILDHIPGGDCWCDPEVEWINEKTGLPLEAGPLYIHNSADRREEEERATGKGAGGWEVSFDKEIDNGDAD